MADELERRVRTLEEELNGERHVSRYAVEQVGLNSEVLHSLRGEVALLRGEVGAVRADISAVSLRVDHLAGNMSVVQAALTRHGRALDVLMQDVRELRGGFGELRGGLDELRGEVGELRSGLSELRGEVGELRSGLSGLRGEVGELRRSQEATNARLDRLEASVARLETNVAAILAAVTPRGAS
jgi:chromosome segregation ATPase